MGLRTHIGDRITGLADEYISTIILENLSKLRSRVGGSSSFNEKLSVWFYRRI